MDKFGTVSTITQQPTPPSSPPRDASTQYALGQSFTLRSHKAPSPTRRLNYDSDDGKVVVSEKSVPANVSKLEWCLSNPSKPGTAHMESFYKITIKEAIRTGDECGAQVVLTSDGQVAKIFDPLFYRFHHDDLPEKKIDITTEADNDYLNEVAAYTALEEADLGGHIAPKYFGAWTADTSLIVNGQRVHREVRLIILEHVVGPRMSELRLRDFGTEEKKRLMRKVIEADTDIKTAGVEHDDFAPRNIILKSSSPKSWCSDPGFRICVIDYSQSCVYKLAGRNPAELKYPNPLFDWAGTDIWSLRGWLPPWQEATEWMWEVWGNGGDEGKYARVKRNLESEMGHPKYPKV